MISKQPKVFGAKFGKVIVKDRQMCEAGDLVKNQYPDRVKCVRCSHTWEKSKEAPICLKPKQITS